MSLCCYIYCHDTPAIFSLLCGWLTVEIPFILIAALWRQVGALKTVYFTYMMPLHIYFWPTLLYWLLLFDAMQSVHFKGRKYIKAIFLKFSVDVFEAVPSTHGICFIEILWNFLPVISNPYESVFWPTLTWQNQVKKFGVHLTA